jgi:hypothetical protein
MKTISLAIVMILFAIIGFSQQKVSDALMDDIQKARASGTTVEALIVLNDQFDTQALDRQLIQQKATCHERGVAVVTALMEHAERTQAELVSYLESRMGTGVISYQPFWITNIIFVEASPDALLDVAMNRGVAQLEQNGHIKLIEPVSMQPASRMSGYAEPGLKAINVHKMWQMGFTGEGVIVGTIDSGVEGTHPALSGSWHGNSVTASQAWYDPVSGTTFPTDIGGAGMDGHGTHTTGIMAGLDVLIADTIGVAFGSEWICARLVNWTDQEILNSMQWLADPDGNPGTTEDMPAVVNNSYGNTPGFCYSSIINAIQNLEAAGVAVIFAAGNEGPAAYTVSFPSESNFTALQAFSVGALDGNYKDLPIAKFSSRGPTTCTQGGDQIKPEVSAPGISVRSSYIGETYLYGAGTSTAAPHVSGAIAILKQAFPEKTGNELKQMLYETARDLGEPGEDNTYGMGIIDVYQAYIENAVPENPRPPNQVTSYSDYTTPSSVALSWTDPNTTVGGEPLENFEINILRDNTLIASIPSGVGQYTDTFLTDGRQYEYSVRTHHIATDSLSIKRKVSAWAGGSPVPVSPHDLSGTFVDPEISLSWSDPATQSDGTPIDDLARIYIYRDQVLLDSVDPGVESYSDNEQLHAQTFCYSLVAGDTEIPANYSQHSSETEIFAGTRPDILIYYGDAFGPVLDYVDSVYQVIRSLDIPVYRTNELGNFGIPLDYNAVFVVTGMFIHYCHQLNSQDGLRLLTYLNSGGSIYIEGNVCFNAANVVSGAYNIRPWLGLDLGDWTLDPVTELSGLNEFSGMNFQYPGLGHTWDILVPSTSTSILWEDPGNGNIYGVYNEYNTGRIIGSVLPYGGLSDTELPEKKMYLMCRYLHMLGIEVECSEGVDEAVGGQRSAVSSYPNPFVGFTTLEYELEHSANVNLSIYNCLGQRVAVLADGEQAAGRQQVCWDAGSAPSGIYFYRLSTVNRQPSTGKLVIK